VLAYQLNRLGKKCRAGLDERVITVNRFMREHSGKTTCIIYIKKFD